MRPRMQAITLEVILRAVFGVGDGERLTRLRERLGEHARPDLATRRALLALAVLGPERLRRFPRFRRALERGRPS